MPRRLLPALSLVLALAGACRRGDDGTKPAGGEELPALTLRDETPDLLLTWIDGKGDAHVAVRVPDVPPEGRNPVRVIAKDAGQGALFYVADLTLKQSDGSYAVHTMPRGDWEAMLEARRQQGKPRPVAAPDRAPSGAPSDEPGRDGERPPRPSGQPQVIVYGAEWCGPCHQAMEYLERRGVRATFYDIEKEPRRAAEMQRKLRDAGRRGGNIPVIDVGGQLFVGFNPRAIDRALDEAKPSGGTAL